MTDLQKYLLETVDDKHVIGMDFGATIDPSDVPQLTANIVQGLKIKGSYTGEPKVTIILADVWSYFRGEELIEDETGCAFIRAEYGGQSADVVLQWAHVNGSTPVDTDGDGK